MKSRISEKVAFIKQVVIPNFVPEPPACIPLGSPFRRFFLYAGRLEAYKGVLDLLKVCKSVDARLVIAGDGPLKDRVNAFINGHHLNGRVTFLG